MTGELKLDLTGARYIQIKAELSHPVSAFIFRIAFILFIYLLTPEHTRQNNRTMIQ